MVIQAGYSVVLGGTTGCSSAVPRQHKDAALSVPPRLRQPRVIPEEKDSDTTSESEKRLLVIREHDDQASQATVQPSGHAGLRLSIPRHLHVPKPHHRDAEWKTSRVKSNV